MAQAIRTSEVGPELAYCLACNPEEAHRIAALPHASQIREIGRLEGRLHQHAEARVEPVRKTATTAPEPPPMLRGGGGRFVIAPDTSDFAAFDKQYG